MCACACGYVCVYSESFIVTIVGKTIQQVYKCHGNTGSFKLFSFHKFLFCAEIQWKHDTFYRSHPWVSLSECAPDLLVKPVGLTSSAGPRTRTSISLDSARTTQRLFRSS